MNTGYIYGIETEEPVNGNSKFLVKEKSLNRAEIEVKEKKIEKITLSLDINLLNENLAEEIIAKIQGNPGEIPLYFNIVDKEEGQNVIMQSQSHKIAPNYKLFEFFDENPSINYFIN